MEIKILVLVAMLFCHIVDDYYLQGFLASAKQKDWWKQNYPDKMYRNDYIMALSEHAFSWTCMILLPLVVYGLYYGKMIVPILIIAFGINWSIHAVVDDMKANKKEINLIQDQLIHITQIIGTWITIMYIWR